MVVHVVMIKFDEKFIDKREKIKKSLEDLEDKIPSLNSMEVGLNFTNSDRAMDLVLISTFDDESKLEEYRVHKAHQEVLEEIKKYATYTKVVDYKN